MTLSCGRAEVADVKRRIPLALLVALALAQASTPSRQSRRSARFLAAAKAAAYDANFRNDQATLRAAVAAFATGEKDPELGPFALYYEGWSEWMLASSQIVAARPADAMASLDSSASAT